jgi:hypothetical protein
VLNISGPTYTKGLLGICGKLGLPSQGVFNVLPLKGSIKNMDHPSVTVKTISK